MASHDVSPTVLDESQQVALGTYTAVTNQEPFEAIPLLQRSQWNVQIAIAKFFDGEAPDPVEEARAALASSTLPQPAQRETLLNGSSSFSRSIGAIRREPAPRVVPQPESQTAYRTPLLLSLIFAPFNLLYRVLSDSLGLFGYLFPFLPRLVSRFSNSSPPARSRQNTTGRKPLNPKDTAARFAREFEEEYGSHSLQFYENGYAQAYDLAKKELKFLLVVLISPEHDDTSTFIRDILLSQEVIDYLNDAQNNILLWAGNVQDSEAYQVSSALNCSKFPFTAVVAHTPQDSSTSMSTIARITGLLPPSAFVPKLRAAITQHSTALDRVRATRNEQQATRNLREEQNSAYERSLAQDRERARQRRAAEAAKARVERDEKARLEAEKRDQRNLERWRSWRAQTIAPEPGPEVKDVTRVSIRMTSGERLVRKFAASAETEELYAFVECYDVLEPGIHSPALAEPEGYEHTYKFRLVSPMPRAVYGLDAGGSIGSRLGRSGNLIVEPISDEDDKYQPCFAADKRPHRDKLTYAPSRETRPCKAVVEAPNIILLPDRGHSMKRFIGSISRRGSQESEKVIPNEDSPEASVARGVRLFCESGGPNNSGEEVLHLPVIVEAAESSPAAAKEAANRICKFLSKENFQRAYVQYNAIMLVRILADNPGKSFTKNLDTKFVVTVKELLRDGRDMSVQQILRETLDTFETQKADDETLTPLRAMWSMEKSKLKKRGAPPVPRAMNAPSYNPIQPQGYVAEQNYFARSHRPSGIPPPHELAQRIEEAKTSAKLLLQVVQSTPPNEILGNELMKEFVDRCQSASRSVQSYIHSDNPHPDEDTLLTLIETNDQLASAISRHQRALLQARRFIGPTTTPATPATEPPNGQPLEMPASPPNGPSSGSGYSAPSDPPPGLPSRSQAPEEELHNPFDDQHATGTERAPQPHDYGMPPSLGQENLDPARTDGYRQSHRAMPSFGHRQELSMNSSTMHGGVEAGPAPPEEARKPIQYRF